MAATASAASGAVPTVVTFSVNGHTQKVLQRLAEDDRTGSDVTATTSLADYLRLHRGLSGTKIMCREGMCGACVVNVTSQNPATGQMESRAVNSCMAPVRACQDWQVETVEGVGNRRDGYHPVQARLAHMNGTQCGYCSPGMIMSMYSLLKSGEEVTPERVEQTMDGNICRCTGYRPILDAFKTFAADTDEKTRQLIRDIEETAGCRGGSGGTCRPSAACAGCPRAAVALTAAEDDWRLPESLPQALRDAAALSAGGRRVRLVAGNTSVGVLDKYDLPSDGYISLLKIPDLRVIERPTGSENFSDRHGTPGSVFGAAVTLSELIRELQLLSGTAGYRHCAEMARHLLLVANTPVRNAGTWAGNLMIKYHHREFPSDVFLLLAAAKAKLKIADENGVEDMDVEKMYGTCMKNKIIVAMALPPLDENKFIFKTYKVTPRAISSHADVNAAFVLPLDPATTEVTERPCLLFGGISGTFAHAAATEHYLTGRRLAEPTTLKAALQTLLDEVQPQPDPELADVVYRRRLAASLLYKAVLHALGERVPARLRSGAEQLTRPGLSGRQQFDTDPALWPVSQAVPKLEAQVQTSGEAEFVDDQPTVPGELYGYYVLSTVGDAQLKVVDGSAALAVKGVHGFVTAKDVIGSNELFTCAMLLKGMGMDTDLLTPELVFADGTVRFCGQPIGLVVADTRELARHAAALVRVEYAQVAPPVVTIRQALKKQPQGMQQSPICPANVTTGDPDGALQAAPRCVSGVWEMGGQDAFAMEAHVARAVPCEDGQLNMSCATQGVKEVVNGVADCVCVPANKINLEVRRLGGGFGGKLSNAVPIACAAALAAIKLNRPVRIVLDVETSMAMCSSRFPHYISYQVGFDDAGRVHGLKLNTVANDGYCITVNSFVEIQQLVAGVQNVYRTDNWSVIPGSVSTNLPPHTAIRGPGMVNGIAAIEMVMDHIAHELRMDPWEVRKANFFAADSQVPRPFDDKQDHEVFARMVEEMFDSGDIVKRQAEIQAFNKANRWRKRALALVPMRYPVALWTKMPAMVSVYDQDGSVAVTCGGVEMGQGLNTKVAQVCALELGVPLHQVSVKPNSSLANPNGIGTGGSISSETSSMAARSACRQLLQRLQPFRAASGQPALSWLQLVQTASQAGVNLTAHAIQSPPAGAPPDMYTVWGLTAVEAELDVLTGESLLHRADVMEDAGQPLSPAVDVGQVEGAFAYGVGLMMTERYRFHPETGRRLTNRAWNYYVPTHKDMPRDFRVKLLKNNRNPVGIFNSKATGEPAVCMSVACLLALRQAVAEARREASLHAWFQFDSPATPERTQMACDVGVEELVLA